MCVCGGGGGVAKGRGGGGGRGDELNEKAKEGLKFSSRVER